MPYDLKTKSGIILRNIPDDMPEDAPELKALAEQQLATQAREGRISKLKADNPGEYDPQSQQWQEKYGATSGMNILDKVAANLGAGMTDVYQGAKQRYNEAFGDETDAKRGREETRQKRVLDKTLAKSVKGGGIIQGVGTAVPLAAAALIPGGQSLALNTAIGAGTGALSGYLQPTEEGESVGINTAIGTGLGAVAPAAIAGLKKTYSVLRELGAGSGAARRASERIAEQLGEESGETLTREAAEQLANQLETQAAQTGGAAVQPVAAPGVGQLVAPGGRGNVAGLQGQQGGRVIPLTTAAQTQNKQLARLEQSSRQRNPDMWLDFDEQQARAVSDRLRAATGEAAEIEARRRARGAGYRASAEAFDQSVDPEAFRMGVQNLREANQAEMLGPEGMNDTVMAALRSIEEKLGREGVELTPAHIRQLRVELASKIDPGNPLRAAPRDNAAIIGMRNRVDDMLNEAGGGQYSPINEAYAGASRGVDQARAAQELRNVFYDPVTGAAKRKARDVAGEIPIISEAALSNAIPRNAAGEARLSGDARAGVDEVLEALRRQDLIMKIKKSGSAGGGSDSVQNLTALANETRREAVEGIAEGVPGGRATVRGVRAVDALINSRRDALITTALQDPAQLAQLLRMVQGASPEVERSVMSQLMRAGASMGERGGIAGATGALSPQVQR